MRGVCRIFCLIGAFAPSVLRADLLPGGVVPFPNVPIMPVEHIAKNSGGWLTPTTFPKTMDDLSFTDRMAIKTKAYEPFKDLSAYHDLIVEGEEQFIERQAALAEFERELDYANMDNQTYCDNYPLDDENCPQTSDTTYDDIVSIGDESDSFVGKYSGATIGGSPVVANNSVRGGSCYPAAKSESFKNQILTTGKYERISPAFEKAMTTLFRKEGKCGIIKGDPCGYTCYGIGENCLGKSIGLNRAALERLTRGEAEDIYYKNYWQKYNIGILPDVIAGDVFLAMMASGSITGIRQFRNFLGVNTLPKDKLDENVVNAVKNYNGDIHNKWLDFRQDFLKRISVKYDDRRVLTAWMRAIKLKRENGCHVIPIKPLLR